jgi:hypothetical protein
MVSFTTISKYEYNIMRYGENTPQGVYWGDSEGIVQQDIN